MLEALRTAQRLDTKFAEFRPQPQEPEPMQRVEPTGESLG
jgi:hypothetical protein